MPLMWLGMVLMVMLVGILGVVPAYAQTAVPEDPPLPAIDEGDLPGELNLTFAELKQPTFDLVSPAIRDISFSLPSNWEIDQQDSYIELNFDVHQLNQALLNTASEEDAELSETIVTILLDDVPLTSFALTPATNQTLQLPVPLNVFTNPDRTQHRLKFVVHQNDCLGTAQSRLVIHDSSNIHLAYDVQTPAINLADFPRPLIHGGILPESLLIIISDDFNEADLSAVAAVAATIGRDVSEPVNVTVAPASAASETLLSNQSVIAVGSPTRNSFIADLYARALLPTTLDDDGVIIADNQTVAAEYAVLQEIPSEFSNEHVYLILTGNDDLGVTKAAQALSAHTPVFGLRNDLAILEDVQESELVEDQVQSELILLADAGMSDTTWTGRGQHKSTIYFTIPDNWDIQDETSLTFSYVLATALDPGASNLRVNLNDKLIGDVPLSNPALGEQQVTVPLPAHLFEVGDYNSVTFVADLASSDPCPSVDAPPIWLRVSNDGFISMPHDLVADERFGQVEAEPFAIAADMRDLLFVLPTSPSEADLYSLAALAQMLGGNSVGTTFAPQVQLAPISDTTAIASFQTIALGRPSTNELITTVNEQLPQPFLAGSDSLGDTAGDLNYQLPADFSLGVIQNIPAPWNSERPFVVVSGTTDEGLRWATDALLTGELNGELDGNLSFVQGAFVESFELLAPKQAEDLIEMSTAIPDSVQTTETFVSTPERTAVAQPNSVETAVSVDEPPPSPIDSMPERYQPPDPTSASSIIYGLIILGFLVLIGGAVFTWRKGKKETDPQS